PHRSRSRGESRAILQKHRRISAAAMADSGGAAVRGKGRGAAIIQGGTAHRGSEAPSTNGNESEAEGGRGTPKEGGRRGTAIRQHGTGRRERELAARGRSGGARGRRRAARSGAGLRCGGRSQWAHASRHKVDQYAARSGCHIERSWIADGGDGVPICFTCIPA